MSRAIFILNDAAAKVQAYECITNAPPGTCVEFKTSSRSLEQNAKMWAMLHEVSEQAELDGRKWSPEEWKAIFMQAAGHEIRALPTLDGGFFPYGHSTKRLTVDEFANLIECIYARGTELGVQFSEGNMQCG